MQQRRSPRCVPAGSLRVISRQGLAKEGAMDQRYVDTVRALKVIQHNLDYLEDAMTPGQRTELNRLVLKLRDGLEDFLQADKTDEGLWIGEE